MATICLPASRSPSASRAQGARAEEVARDDHEGVRVDLFVGVVDRGHLGHSAFFAHRRDLVHVVNLDQVEPDGAVAGLDIGFLPDCKSEDGAKQRENEDSNRHFHFRQIMEL